MSYLNGWGIKPTKHVRYIIHSMTRHRIPQPKNFLCLLNELIVEVRHQSGSAGASKQTKTMLLSLSLLESLYVINTINLSKTA